jgi:hypothetical protein
LFSARDTVVCETPASRATSWMVTDTVAPLIWAEENED